MRSVFRRLIRGPTGRRSILSALALATFLGAASISPSPAVSQTLIPHERIVALLEAQYGEAPVARGLVENGWLLEVFASKSGETWTVVLTTPQGMSRIGSAGVAWTELAPQHRQVAQAGHGE